MHESHAPVRATLRRVVPCWVIKIFTTPNLNDVACHNLAAHVSSTDAGSAAPPLPPLPESNNVKEEQSTGQPERAVLGVTTEGACTVQGINYTE